MWNLGTAVNRSELEEIKSIRLRDNFKIHQQQTEYMVTSLKIDAKLEFRRRQYNFTTSIDLEEKTEVVNFIPFTFATFS